MVAKREVAKEVATANVETDGQVHDRFPLLKRCRKLNRITLTHLDGSDEMAALPTAVKLHIITALACFESPTQVATSVQAQFGLALSRQRIEAWHPERVAGAKLDTEWRAIFADARKRFLDELDNIPIAHRSYRLRQLGRILERAEEAGNIQLSNQVLEQAAKEVGDVYVKRRRSERADSSGPASVG